MNPRKRDRGGTGWRRFRVRAWLALLATTVAAITIGLVALSQRTYRELSIARMELADAADPAYISGLRLAQGFTAQEAAVAGHALTGESDAANRYRRATLEANAAATELRRLTETYPHTLPADEINAGLTAVLAASEQWRTGYAEPTVETINQSGIGAVSSQQHAAGQAQFDAVRQSMSQLGGVLEQERNAARARLDLTADRFEKVIVGGLAILLLALIAVAATVRQTVIRPLSMLSRQVRRVARGEYHQQLEVEGALEIRRLVQDIDAMRQRILLELDESTAARELLDAQTLELRRSNAELEQFAYVASHDLREPLRKVASFCQLIERRYGDQLDDRGRQYIDFAVDGANRMQVLINDLLAFSRVGRTSEGFVAVDSQQSLDRVKQLLSSSIEDADAEVRTEAPLPIVYGDQVLVDQLLQNLLSNAIKFRRDGVPPEVRITVRRDGDMWEFTCADNGIGIESDYAERIFVIFQRLHPRDQYGGTGIGLALCKKIVEYHGGRIWLDSNGRQGTGAVFRFTLPGTPPLALASDGEMGSHVSTEQAEPVASAASGGES
ncbi:MAG TPA: ATP-binding protein [Actinomycetes bacterium]|nr:ATP-binding protein [Actinomycetes bacterium]